MAVEHLIDTDESRADRHPAIVPLINADPREVVAEIERDLADQPTEVRQWVTRAVLAGMVALRRGGR